MWLRSFEVYLNDLNMASEYVIRLVDEITSGPVFTQSFFIPTEIDEVKSSLGELRKLSQKMAGINKVNTSHTGLFITTFFPAISQSFLIIHLDFFSYLRVVWSSSLIS